MKAKIGVLFMILGAVMVLGAVGLFGYNFYEQTNADESTQLMMPQLVAAIQQRQEESQTEPTETEPDNTEPDSDLPTEKPVILPDIEEKRLPVVEIDGYGYIGFITIATLDLELPIMADWSYPQLKISPCRYVGDVYTDDLVLMAHNYSRHFGRIGELKAGDVVAFTDMDGNTIFYEVIAVEVLNPTAVEEMTSGEFDLTLFTCTYGGKTRVTVRCDRIET